MDLEKTLLNPYSSEWAAPPLAEVYYSIAGGRPIGLGSSEVPRQALGVWRTSCGKPRQALGLWTKSYRKVLQVPQDSVGTQ